MAAARRVCTELRLVVEGGEEPRALLVGQFERERLRLLSLEPLFERELVDEIEVMVCTSRSAAISIREIRVS
jgi:hypothetical protein